MGNFHGYNITIENDWAYKNVKITDRLVLILCVLNKVLAELVYCIYASLYVLLND